MKRANFTYWNQKYNGFIVIENMSDLIDYFHERLYGMQKESARSLVDRARGIVQNGIVSHPTDPIVQIVEIESNFRGGGILINHAKIMGILQQQWVEAINENLNIAINPINGVSHFMFPKTIDLEIISEHEKYTEADIKVLRWTGGAHWYAKIGFIDVVIDGEQKWNARWQAEEKAKQFLSEMLMNEAS